MPHEPTSRVDLHCHSTASQEAKLGVQRALGLPECATPPEEVYALAKRRGMDFVTITDHDTVSGALEIADRPDVFISEELTARFRGEPQAVHVLCLGITEADHEELQARSEDVEACADYLHGNGIACALAHPFFAVAAPLTPRHRRRLAELFPVWETRNGARAPELNQPAVVYVETRGATGVGGSDDHAGVDIGRTWTATPSAGTPAAFLEHVRAGRAAAEGAQGSAEKWVHAAIALATRVLPERGADAPPPRPEAVLTMVERFVREGAARRGAIGADLEPGDAAALLEAWLTTVGIEERGPDLLAVLQADGFRHADLARRARRAHESLLAQAVTGGIGTAARRGDFGAATGELFTACLPAVPYAPAAAFLGREKANLAPREAGRGRVALIADGIGDVHGVARTIDQIRARGVEGFEIDVVGTDGNVDRRLSAVADVAIPFYPGLRVGVPSLPCLVETLADGAYDAVHLTVPGPAGVAAALVARALDVPVVGSYHTELAAYAELRSGDPRLAAGATMGLGAFYGACDLVLSPSASADASLRDLGVAPQVVARWGRGVDLARFGPEHRVEGSLPGEVTVLYAGRVTREKGADLLAQAFLAARERDPRLHLVVAGGGPEEGALREQLGDHVTLLGWLAGDALSRAYASADLFVFPSRTDTFGQVVLEAQASGLAVVAIGEGGPLDLIRDAVNGRLCPPRADALAGVMAELAGAPEHRARLAQAGLAAAGARTWEGSLRELASGYRRVLGGSAVAGRRAA